MAQSHDAPADTIRLKIFVVNDEDLGNVDISLPRGVPSRTAGRILTAANKLMHRVAVASGMVDTIITTLEIDGRGWSRPFGNNGGPAGMPAPATADGDSGQDEWEHEGAIVQDLRPEDER